MGLERPASTSFFFARVFPIRRGAMSRPQSPESESWPPRPITRALPVPPCGIAPYLFCDTAWAGIRDKLGLSVRQASIVRYVVADECDAAIARALGLSRSTVHTHMDRLHKKLDVHTRVELVGRIVAAYLTWRTESPPPPGCRLSSRLESH